MAAQGDSNTESHDGKTKKRRQKDEIELAHSSKKARIRIANESDTLEKIVKNSPESKEERRARKAQKRHAKQARRNAQEKGEGLEDSLEVAPQGYKMHLELGALPQSEIDDYLQKSFITTEGSGNISLRPIFRFDYLPRLGLRLDNILKDFRLPTPIQAVSWPYALSGRDVVGVAETGSGKTLAFGIPLAKSIAGGSSTRAKRDCIQALVVSPTRELALQTHAQLADIAKENGFRCVCVYGGVPKDEQRNLLKTAQVVIATPGRLNDFIQEGSADLSSVTYAVLDEADRMLDKGFENEIRKILSEIAPRNDRQVLMFTATWPQSIRELAATFMQDPIKIAIGDNPSGDLRANVSIEQIVEVVDPRSKDSRLQQLLKQYQAGNRKNHRILVFCLYKKEASRVEYSIRSRGFNVAGIHGDMPQPARTKSLDAFKAGEVSVLVATDVAARGLDIPEVMVVINVTFPLTVEDYVHRIGRTGRAGNEGLAITLFTEHEKGLSGALINVLKAAKQDVPPELLKFGGTVKKKEHSVYGAFYKDDAEGQTSSKITFD